jgi:hypothetical protein
MLIFAGVFRVEGNLPGSIQAHCLAAGSHAWIAFLPGKNRW